MSCERGLCKMLGRLADALEKVRLAPKRCQEVFTPLDFYQRAPDRKEGVWVRNIATKRKAVCDCPSAHNGEGQTPSKRAPAGCRPRGNPTGQRRRWRQPCQQRAGREGRGNPKKTLAHPQNSRWKYFFGRSTQMKNKELSAVAPYDVEPRALSSR